MVFLCCIMYKYESLASSDELRAKMSFEQVSGMFSHIHRIAVTLCTYLRTVVGVALTQREYFSVPGSVLSLVLFLGVLSSLIFAGALVAIQVGLNKWRRQSELAKLRQLLAPGERSLTRMLKGRDGGAGLAEGSVGRALVRLGVVTNDAAGRSCEPQTAQNPLAQPSEDEVELATAMPAQPTIEPGTAQKLPRSRPRRRS
jgi:hypothetical protein